MELLKQYFEYRHKLNSYNTILAIAHYDLATIAPSAGKAYNYQMLNQLSGEAFELLLDPMFIELQKNLLNEELDEYVRKEIEYNLKETNKIINVPKEEYIQFRNLASEAEMKWEEAKKTDDYKLFEPALLAIIQAKRKLMAYRNVGNIYEAMLNDFEQDVSIEKYDAFFALLEEKLVPFIKKVNEHNHKIKNDMLYFEVTDEVQKKVADRIAEYLDYGKDWGYIATSMHPFSTKINNNDTRITTHFDSKDPFNSVFSVIHEIGHSTYDYQSSRDYKGHPLDTMITMGMHESQSRLLENYIGRSYAFWKYNYPLLQQEMPALKDVSLETFYLAINKSYPSLIRTLADELTYPIHILIRYKIEKGICDGSIDVHDLERVWNEMMVNYLGVQVDKASHGILQDIHWTSGEFGYFPTYALGSAYAAQFYHQMRRDLDVDHLLESNQFPVIKQWLKDHIHQYGGFKTADEILMLVTNEKFNPKYYVEYLINKFTKIYQFD